MYQGPKGSSQRRAALDKHVAHIVRHGAAAPKGVRGPAGPKTPAEHKYVQIEVAKRLKGPAGVRGPVGPVRMRPPHNLGRVGAGGFNGPIGRKAALQGGTGSSDMPDNMGLLPSLGNNLYHSLGGEILAHAVRHPLGYTLGSSQFKADLGRNDRAANADLEGLTSYKEIQHIGRHPLSGGLALASLLPFGRFGKLAELAKASDVAGVAAKAADARIVAKTAKAERLSAKGGIAAKRGARLTRQLAQRGAPRTPEQIAAHIQEHATITKSMGHGLPIPKLEPGQITERTGGALGAKFRAAVKDLPAIRAAQEDARLPERAKVFSRLNKEQKKALKSDKPFENLVAANTTRAGKLPSGEFHGFDNLTPEELNQATLHMANNTGLIGHSLENAGLAIKAAIREGSPLAKHEQAYIEHAFGREVNPKELAASRSGWHKLVDVFGIPRATMAGVDISGMGRQAIGALAYDPKVWSEGLSPMFKSLVKEGNYQELEDALHANPNFPLWERGGLAMPDLGKEAGQAEYMAQSEGKYISNVAERLNLRELPIPGVKGKKWATGPGDLVRMGDRSYMALLVTIRTRLFDTLLHQAVANGWNIDDHLLQSIGDLSNVLTGRGDLLPGHGVTMNALFFSPKLLYSRLNMLGFGGGGVRSAIPGSWYYSLHPFARAQAMRATGQLLATLGVVLTSARMLGASVSHDPRNADFGKIRLGNTRIDIAAGLQQPIRLMSQLATGQVVSSTTGKLENLGGGFAGRSRLDAMQQFVEGKAAPIPSIFVDLMKGQQFNGQPLDWSANPLDTNSEITGHLMPLSAQDALNTAQQTHSTLAGIGGGLLSATGVGIGSYSAVPKNSPDKIKAAMQKVLDGTASTPGLREQLKTMNITPKYRAYYTKAAQVQVERNLAKDQARNLSPDGKITEAQSYKITLQTMQKNGLISPADVRNSLAAVKVKGMSDRDIRHWEYEAWTYLGFGNEWGPGKLLESLHSAYNVKTGSTG